MGWGATERLTLGFGLPLINDREAGAAAALYLHARIPAYQNVNDAQLAPLTALLMGVSRGF